jgi:ABC-type transport system involved in cytochrome c biogenesis permease component
LNFLSKVRTIVWKDFTHELRSREMLISMCVFSFLVIIIFNFAFPPGMEGGESVAPSGLRRIRGPSKACCSAQWKGEQSM